MVDFEENSYLEMFRDLKLFFREYVDEQLLSPIISNDKLKDYSPIELLNLRFQVHHISPKKIRFSEEYDENPVKTNLYQMLVKHREIKVISDGIKIVSVEDI